MHRIYRSIDRLNDGVGSVVAWFALAMVLIQFVLVLMRYIYSANAFAGLSALWWQESIVYLHGGLIMLAAAYTFLHNGHVRVATACAPSARASATTAAAPSAERL